MSNKISEILDRHKVEIEKELVSSSIASRIRLKRNDDVRPWKSVEEPPKQKGSHGPGKEATRRPDSQVKSEVVSRSSVSNPKKRLDLEQSLWLAIKLVYQKKLVFILLCVALSGMLIYATKFIPKTYTSSSEIFVSTKTFENPLAAIDDSLLRMTNSRPPQLLELPIARIAVKLGSPQNHEVIAKRYEERYEKLAEGAKQFVVTAAYNKNAEILFITAQASTPYIASNIVELSTRLFFESLESHMETNLESSQTWLKDGLRDVEFELSGVKSEIEAHRSESSSSQSYKNIINDLNKKRVDAEIATSRLRTELVRLESAVDGSVSSRALLGLQYPQLEELQAMYLLFQEQRGPDYRAQLRDVRENMKEVASSLSKKVEKDLKAQEGELRFITRQLDNVGQKRNIAAGYSSSLDALSKKEDKLKSLKDQLSSVLMAGGAGSKIEENVVVVEAPVPNFDSASPRNAPLIALCLALSAFISTAFILIRSGYFSRLKAF